MTKSKLAAVTAVALLFVGSVAALAYALDPENSAEAKADYCESLRTSRFVSASALTTSLRARPMLIVCCPRA